MRVDERTASTCCRAALPLPLGGVPPSDFAALDAVAVKLISLDAAFGPPLREMGKVLGGRIAAEQALQQVPLSQALSTLIAACGLEGVVTAEFVDRTEDSAVLKLEGCAEALGWQIPVVGRTVCSYDSGLFEGFLRGVTGDGRWTVDEVSCLGLGHPACQFAIGQAGARPPDGGHDAER